MHFGGKLVGSASSRSSESAGAIRAGADASEVIIAEDAGGVAVGKGDLDGVIADGCGLLSASLGLKHGQGCRGSWRGTRKRGFSYSLVIARSARTFVAQVWEIVMAGVAVGPDDVDTRAAGHVNFYAGG